nr:CopD family protein [Thermostichus vulcanus]
MYSKSAPSGSIHFTIFTYTGLPGKPVEGLRAWGRVCPSVPVNGFIDTPRTDVATWAMPGLILAGVGMGGIHRGWTLADPYGQYLWAKLILVLMIMALGAHNKFRLVPALREGHLAVRSSLQSIVRLEGVGLLMVLALSSFLVAQAPPSHG